MDSQRRTCLCFGWAGACAGRGALPSVEADCDILASNDDAANSFRHRAPLNTPPKVWVRIRLNLLAGAGLRPVGSSWSIAETRSYSSFTG